MNRLQAECHRLYLCGAPTGSVMADDHTSLIDPDGRVRAMVLSLARPADWAALSAVWQAVQSEMGLPAPAIAVSGIDAYQLWFSLSEAVPAPEAHAFLASLCHRYLSHIAPSRIGLLPATSDAEAPQQAFHLGMLPGQQTAPDQWSAFLAPDLAPMFAETPWLDMPPNPEGQAELLQRQQSITSAAWQHALSLTTKMAMIALPPCPSAGSATGNPTQDPRLFLLKVMNDETVELALRIEAAKALLS